MRYWPTESLGFVAALGLGAYFFWAAVRGFWVTDDDAWAKKLFVASLIYLTALFALIILDVAVFIPLA
mgnify:CR=1 FL=1